MNFEEEEKIAKALAQTDIQEPFLFRTLARARFLADFFIDEGGSLKKKNFPSFLTGIQGENDKIVLTHFKFVMDSLLKNKDLITLFNRFRVPVSNRYIEKLIIYSLGLPLQTKVTSALFRKAILSALLTPLRQNVGSCFATAPAIVIQKEQLERLLLDLYDLTMSSHLSRTFGGAENVVPISPSSGVGDLKKPISLSNPKVFESPGVEAALQVAGISVSEAKELVPEQDFTSLDTLIKRAIYRKYNFKEHGLNQSLEAQKVLSLEEEAKETFKAFTDHALLKTWEYTLASFSDYKIEFYKWNLYASLGFDAKEKGGIAHLLYEVLQGKLTEENQKTEEHHQEYARAIDEVNMTQALLRQASSRDRIRQLKTELDMRLHHARVCQEMRDDSHESAEHLANFLKVLLDSYAKKFPEYFQEIYDAAMHDVETTLYDDSPAGFRLLFKHGRRDPSVWTLIQDGKTYVQSLKSFFIAVEPMIAAESEWEKGEEVLQELTTLLMHHLDTEEFLISAIERMGKAHQTVQKRSSLENIERFEKKPWSYTSGGTMHTLIRCYYCLEKELSEESRQIESPMDLLIFLLDLMKSLPYNVTRPFEENSEKGMLMYSPTHAFVFRPGLLPFKEGWLDKGFSYTWARDTVLIPGEVFYEAIRLDREMQQFLAERFFHRDLKPHADRLTYEFSPHAETLHIPDFRSYLLKFLTAEIREPILLSDRIDGFLRTAFPLIRAPEMEQLLEGDSYYDPLYTFLDAYDFLLSKGMSFDAAKNAFKAQDLLPPETLLFADTNWSRFFFGIGYNPGIGALDLWRLDARQREGYPLSSWRSFLDGTNPKPWGVLTAPSEYSGHGLQDFNLLKNKV